MSIPCGLTIAANPAAAPIPAQRRTSPGRPRPAITLSRPKAASSARPDFGPNVVEDRELIAQALLALSGSRLVTIAAVPGAAVAGGAGLMSACDMAVAAAGTKIGYPEPRRGLVAGLVMTFIRRQLRERDAREILLTGELFSAERALEIGMVNRVAPTADAAFAEAGRLADSVRQGGPKAVQATKRLLAELWHRSVKEDLDRALAAHMEARNSTEAAEGIAAYHERRLPKWAPKPPGC